MSAEPSGKSRAWPMFDAIVAAGAGRHTNPWALDETGEPRFHPDYGTLEKLLAVPLQLAATSQSGVPALAIDVWVAYELRRAALDPDAVWPREQAPRVVDRDVLRFIESLPKQHRAELIARLERGSGSVASASANILGKNYLKQIDVLMTSWQTGPELLISTKRMDSSFGKNAANRVEESYGDAKNLALRHPLAALGFVYSLRSTAYTQERYHFDWLVDLLTKLGREDDAYDACALIVPEWEGVEVPDEPDTVPEPEVPELFPELFAGPEPEPDEPGLFELHLPTPAAETSAPAGTAAIDRLPTVRLRHDLVPDELSPARFFTEMLTIVLYNSTVAQHRQARALRESARTT
ncbi:hypothetical protein GII33_02590 [Gordonia pseudamarae]|uniref:hypothetical protein n=1 Tax=Gordonia TaxID=2053 RepID=UPI0019BC20F7|nr:MULTISPECIES: hypothetical protein [Gordonia]MBD0022320.1 hypothetical protein [Gordonia sp. (in: high G+C Gram-positive bacteria)]QHN25022.1 hypothetical protein GII33_02590 [Gordonia pseudamarae]